MDVGLEKAQDLTTMPISLNHLLNEHKFKSTSMSPSPRYFVLKSPPEAYFTTPKDYSYYVLVFI